jgi:glutathione synthase/RimK-type ligase-like ATP-grasp enzyme
MRIAIHNSPNSFAQEWIAYCESANINYHIVNCYDNDIINQLKDCDGLMWHFHHMAVKDLNMARSLLFALQHIKYPTFPDFKTMWHFDDKVGQKYLLEILELPMVPSYTFYNLKDAKAWIESTTFPKVFKLRGGAGSANVQLAKDKNEALRLVSKAFTTGFTNYDSLDNLKERFRLYRKGKLNLWDVTKGILRIFHKPKYASVMGRELNYAYFQDFIPENDFDIRVIVVGNKAFAIKRLTRKGDFRASGSGNILYDKIHFDDNTISVAFNASKKLESQCVAFDFVYLNDQPLIVEISYGFAKYGYINCTGYWDSNLTWHEGEFDPYGWMVDNLVEQISSK